MLKAIHIIGYMTCKIDSEVLTFVSQDMHSITATVYMQRQHCSQYRFTSSDDAQRFTVMPNALIACLGVNSEAMVNCRPRTLEPEEEFIGLNLGDKVSLTQA
ncbi:unnamed protein product [Umbelopsis ramanniana]